MTEDIRASAAVRKDAMEDFSRAAGKAWQVGIRRQELSGILDQVFGKEEGK